MCCGAAQGIWVRGIHSCVSPTQGLRWAEEALGIGWGMQQRSCD